MLDGDLLAVLEALYHEVTARKELERSFEDMNREINHLIDQLTEDERRAYLAESLFLNQVKYENDKLEAYLRKLGNGRRLNSALGTRHVMSLNYLATRYHCSWPWEIGVLLCDGRMVCGCADPYAKRVLGDARTTSIAGIWTGPVASQLRADLNQGGSSFCGDCPLKLPLGPTSRRRSATSTSAAIPERLYIECTAACNISCNQAVCAPETGITRTRQAGMLDFDLFTKVIDEAGPSLGRIDFFNYGEAFLHKRAVEMCEYIKTKFPHIYLYTSTNGLAFTEEKVRQLARSGIDEVTFSLDGASQETYVQYRQRGNFDKAIANLRALLDERAKTGRDAAVRELALHPLQVERLRRRDEQGARDGRRHRRRSPVLGDHRSSRGFVLAALRAGHARLRAHPPRDLGQQRPRQRDSRRHAARRNLRPHRAAGPAVHDAAVDAGVADRARQEPVEPSVPRAVRSGRRPPRGPAGRAADRRQRHRDQSRSRARVAAGRSRAGTIGRRADRSHRAGEARTLRVEVRPGQRRHRLVRIVRLANHHSRVVG